MDQYDPLHLPCGGTAHFDEGAGYGYRCELCGAVVCSIGMPSRCRSEWDKYEKVLPALGSRVRWDLKTGSEVIDEV